MTAGYAIALLAVALWMYLMGYGVGFARARTEATKLIHHQLLFIAKVYEELHAAYPKGDAPLREKVKEVLPSFELLLEHPSVAHQLELAKKGQGK